MITCPACGGTGKIFYDESGDRITPEEYNKLSSDQRDCENCIECDGTGGIENVLEFEYDY